MQKKKTKKKYKKQHKKQNKTKQKTVNTKKITSFPLEITQESLI